MTLKGNVLALLTILSLFVLVAALSLIPGVHNAIAGMDSDNANTSAYERSPSDKPSYSSTDSKQSLVQREALISNVEDCYQKLLRAELLQRIASERLTEVDAQKVSVWKEKITTFDGATELRHAQREFEAETAAKNVATRELKLAIEKLKENSVAWYRSYQKRNKNPNGEDLVPVEESRVPSLNFSSDSWKVCFTDWLRINSALAVELREVGRRQEELNSAGKSTLELERDEAKYEKTRQHVHALVLAEEKKLNELCLGLDKSSEEFLNMTNNFVREQILPPAAEVVPEKK